MNKIISTIVIISILICCVNINTVKADVDISSFDTAINMLTVGMEDDDQQKFIDGWNILLQNAGFMSGYITSTSVGSIVDYVADVFDDNLQNASTQEKIDALCDYVVNGGLAEDSQGNYYGTEIYNNLIKATENFIVNNSGVKYVYSIDVNRFTSSFSNGAIYQGLKDIVNDNQGENKVIFWSPAGYYGSLVRPCVEVFDLENIGLIKWSTGLPNNNYLMVDPYDIVTWQLALNHNATNKKVYYWDSTNNEFVNDNSLSNPWFANRFRISELKENNALPPQFVEIQGNYTVDKFCISNNRVFTYSLYSDIATLKNYSDGKAPYYYNNDVWQDFSSSTNGYTFTPTNINTVTYGDTISYVDSFNTEHGYYPSVDTIEKHIEEKNDDNHNSGSGGSGSGDDESGSIFDWLKSLGKVLGDLIKGVGEFLTEIVSGLVSAITDLLSSLSGLISDITQSIPTVFGDFLGALLGWLPAEIRALISLAIVAMVLVGIIKLIRG